MATLREYFETDYNYALSTKRERTFTARDGRQLVIIERLHLDFRSNAKYISYFIPITSSIEQLCCGILENVNWGLSLTDSVLTQVNYFTDQPHPNAALEFTRLIIFYVDHTVDNESISRIVKFGNERKLFVQFRDTRYAKQNSVCSAKYLFHFLMKKKDELLVPLMRGSANVSLKERDIADVEITLPPISEQRRIVARIEELAAKVEEARGLQKQVFESLDLLCRAIIVDTRNERPISTLMSELVIQRKQDVTVRQDERYQFAGVYCFGRGVFKGQSKSGMEFAYKTLTRLRTGDFVYPKLMAWEGAFGIVPPECDGLVVSPEFPVFTVNQKKLRPEVLDVYFRNPNVWPEIAGKSTGTNVRRRRLNPSDFLSFVFPLPSLSTQDRLCGVKHRVDTLKKLQAETAAELDAMLPSILDKAFNGEL